jgi:hypothetical protein
VTERKILDDDEWVTSSDHEAIEWEFKGSDNGIDQAYLIRGWFLTPLMGSNPETVVKRMVVKVVCMTSMAAYPHLSQWSGLRSHVANLRAPN